jgi:hypothetical protein
MILSVFQLAILLFSAVIIHGILDLGFGMNKGFLRTVIVCAVLFVLAFTMMIKK